MVKRATRESRRAAAAVAPLPIARLAPQPTFENTAGVIVMGSCPVCGTNHPNRKRWDLHYGRVFTVQSTLGVVQDPRGTPKFVVVEYLHTPEEMDAAAERIGEPGLFANIRQRMVLACQTWLANGWLDPSDLGFPGAGRPNQPTRPGADGLRQLKALYRYREWPVIRRALEAGNLQELLSAVEADVQAGTAVPWRVRRDMERADRRERRRARQQDVVARVVRENVIEQLRSELEDEEGGQQEPEAPPDAPAPEAAPKKAKAARPEKRGKQKRAGATPVAPVPPAAKAPQTFLDTRYVELALLRRRIADGQADPKRNWLRLAPQIRERLLSTLGSIEGHLQRNPGVHYSDELESMRQRLEGAQDAYNRVVDEVDRLLRGDPNRADEAFADLLLCCPRPGETLPMPSTGELAPAPPPRPEPAAGPPLPPLPKVKAKVNADDVADLQQYLEELAELFEDAGAITGEGSLVMTAIGAGLEGWLAQVNAMLDKEEEKRNPDEDKVSELETKRDALDGAIKSLRDADAEEAAKALGTYE